MGALFLDGLALSHFRSFRDVELDPGPGMVALFGANGAGKTNLLEAVSLLSPGRGLRRASMGEMARRPDGPGWKVAARVARPDGQRVEIETRSEAGAARTLRIDGKPAPKLAVAAHLRVLWLMPAMDRLWTEAAEGRRRFLDRAAMSLIPGHGEAALAYEKAMRERNRLLKDGVADPGWYAALEARMAETGAAVTGNREAAIARLFAAQRDHVSGFPAADLALRDAEGETPLAGEETLAAALAEGRARDIQAGRTLTGPHRHDLEAVYAAKAMPARSASTGEQKALLIALVLANARALAADFGAPPILLLDEVAAHLDAERREALFAEITGLGSQAWLTGTGPELFHSLEGRARFLEVTLEGGESVVAPADPPS